MSRFQLKSKFWECIPDKEKSTLQKWSKSAHLTNNELIRNVISCKKSAQRILFSLNILSNNITTIQHDFNNNFNHLKNLLDFGASGKLSSNFRNSGFIIKKKLSLILGLFYTIPMISSKQMKLKSGRPAIKYYRDFYTLLQFAEIEVQNQINPIKSKMFVSKLKHLQTEINLKFKMCKDRLNTLTVLIKNSP